ncbi:hypothetical protein ACKGJY_12675 [Hyunsoonleella sp. 2307UL5-6]|uniref:hypothetical protein n=1 Tax=Hyunsoonleella sp. 2307UL5-6 TaxID=3384768 RepID=UPI0039BC5B85
MKNFLIILLIVSVLSCSKEENTDLTINKIDNFEAIFDTSKKNEHDAILNDYSKLIGYTLNKPKVLEYLDSEMKPLSQFGDKISLSYLLGKEEGLRENEIEQFIFAKNLKQNVFVSQLKSEIKNNSKVLTHLIDKLNVNNKSLNDESVINYILDNIANEHLEIYVPYKELENTVNEDFFLCII